MQLAVHGLKQCLADQNDFCITTTSADEIKGGFLRNSCSLLVLPGGRDLPYHIDLSGAGNKEIQDFIHSGGSYLGLCAGGYYGADYIEFSKGDPMLEVCGERELKLFPGVAVGPVFPGFEYRTNAGARAISISLTEDMLQMLHLPKIANRIKVFYNGGAHFDVSLFHGQERHESKKNDIVCIKRELDLDKCRVLAQYTDPPSKPAIVACYCSSGRAVLTGVHPEAGVEGLLSAYGTDDTRINDVSAGIADHELHRQALFMGILHFLLKI